MEKPKSKGSFVIEITKTGNKIVSEKTTPIKSKKDLQKLIKEIAKKSGVKKSIKRNQI